MVLTIKEIAEARGFKNAKQLADTAGIRYKSMYPIWNGTARMIALDTLERLCKALRVQVGMLFEIIPDAEPLPGATEPADAKPEADKKAPAKAGSKKGKMK